MMRRGALVVSLLLLAACSREKAFDDFVGECATELMPKQLQLQKNTAGDHFYWSTDGKLLFWSAGKPTWIADLQFVGDVSTKSNSWRWAWNNPAVPPGLAKDSQRVRELGRLHRYDKLVQPTWPATPNDGFHMTAVQAHVTGADAAYSRPISTGTAYMVLHNLRAVNVKLSDSVYTVHGHPIHLQCTQSGAPAVIFEGETWRDVVPAIAPFARVCTVDRAALSDLHDLLGAAQIAPPYVLVGHSFGTYASKYPRDVAGLVLVDSTESIDLEHSNAHIPLVVIARGGEKPPVALQRELASRSPRGTLILAEHSRHFIENDEPELVVGAVRGILATAR